MLYMQWLVKAGVRWDAPSGGRLYEKSEKHAGLATCIVVWIFCASLLSVVVVVVVVERAGVRAATPSPCLLG